MERLTRRMPGGYGLMEGYTLDTPRAIRVVIDRLASYEESGLTPEEVVAMKKKLVALEKIVAFNTSCTHCKHISLDAQQEPCLSCDPGMEKSAWEWEGD